MRAARPDPPPDRLPAVRWWPLKGAAPARARPCSGRPARHPPAARPDAGYSAGWPPPWPSVHRGYNRRTPTLLGVYYTVHTRSIVICGACAAVQPSALSDNRSRRAGAFAGLLRGRLIYKSTRAASLLPLMVASAAGNVWAGRGSSLHALAVPTTEETGDLAMCQCFNERLARRVPQRRGVSPWLLPR